MKTNTFFKKEILGFNFPYPPQIRPDFTKGKMELSTIRFASAILSEHALPFHLVLYTKFVLFYLRFVTDEKIFAYPSSMKNWTSCHIDSTLIIFADFNWTVLWVNHLFPDSWQE